MTPVMTPDMTRMTDPTEIAAGPGSAADVVSPLASKMLFWRARYVRQSEALYHLPFLFWLVEALRPARAVVLGVGDGVAHFALCQAVDKLDLATRIHGIDLWPADPGPAEAGPTDPGPTDPGPANQKSADQKPTDQPPAVPDPAKPPPGAGPGPGPVPGAAGPEVPATIRAYNASTYAEISCIEAMDQSALLARTAAGSVDLLYVDLAVTAQVADALTYAWPTKLSQRGVMLLHGTGRNFASPAAQGLLAQLGHSRQTISFQAGDGLLVLLWGPEQPYRLTRLATLAGQGPQGAGDAASDGASEGANDRASDGASDAEIKLIFTRLGLLHRLEWEAPHEARAHQTAATALTTARTGQQAAQTALQDLQKAYDARHLRTATLQVRIHDLEQERAALQAATQARVDAAQVLADQAEAQADQAKAQADQAQIQAGQAKAQADQAQIRADQAEAAQDRLAADCARLTATLTSREADWQAGDSHLQDIMALTAALSQVQAEKHALIEAARRPAPNLHPALNPALNPPMNPVRPPSGGPSGGSSGRSSGSGRRRKGLWARLKGSALLAPVLAPVRSVRRSLRTALRGGRSGPDAAPGLLTRFKRSALLAPVRALVQRRRRRREARIRAGLVPRSSGRSG